MKAEVFKPITIRFTITTVIASLLLGSHQRLASQSNIVACESINAQWNGSLLDCSESPGGVCAAGTINAGPLKGTTATVYYGMSISAGMTNVEPASTFSYFGVQTIHTAHGDLHARAVGIADNVRHVFTEISRVIGGTGRFTNATGNLFVSGTLSANGTNFQSRITGEICLNRPSS